jgi:hypothetical protein
MKLFDKQAEKRVLVSIILSIPFLCFVLWKQNGEIGITEFIIIVLTLLLAIGVLYLMKWYANKE